MPDAVREQRIVLPPGLSAAEVHAHTLASDGMVTAPELVRAAAAIGLSAVCVTDHDTIPDLSEAIDVGAGPGWPGAGGAPVHADVFRVDVAGTA